MAYIFTGNQLKILKNSSRKSKIKSEHFKFMAPDISNE